MFSFSCWWLRGVGPFAGLVFEDEGVEEGLGGAAFFGIELSEGFELEAELRVGVALSGLEDQGVGRDPEGLGQLPNPLQGGLGMPGFIAVDLNERELGLEGERGAGSGRGAMRVVGLALVAVWWPVMVAAQVLPQIAPSGTVNDPKIRVANTVGHQVTFTVTNLNGGTDGQVSRTCTRTGNVTSVTCSTLTFMAEGQVAIVTATFTTSAAGTGTITLTVDPTNPDGPPVSGTWQETIVAPAGTITPDGLALVVAPNQTGLTQAFTITNTSRAETSVALAVSSCPNTAMAACSLSPSPVTPDSAGSGNNTKTSTLTFTSGAAGTQGTATVTGTAGGVTLDQGSITVAVANASVSPATATAAPQPGAPGQTFAFTVTNNGVVTTSYTLAAVCAGAGVQVTPCGVTPTALTDVAASATGGATVSYTAGAAGTTGTVTLQVKLGTVVLATGVLTVNVATPTVVMVTPDGGAPVVRPPATASSQSFDVKQTSGPVPAVYNRAGQSALRKPARGPPQDPHPAETADHRRDRLHPDRPPRGQSLLSTGVASLRERLDPPHRQSKPRRLGGGLRRSRHRQRDPRSVAPPRHDGQHQRRFLSPQGQTPRRIAPPRSGPRSGGVTPPQVGTFKGRRLGSFG